METLQPKLRFPEFEGNWELKQFKEITSLITKGTTPKNFSENGINFIKIECLNGHNIDTSKCLFIDEETHTKELKRSILKENDLLFAIAGATIGKCTIVTKEALPANTNQALAIIRLKEKENKDYIFQILTSEGMSKYIKDNISVGAQPNLNLEQINSFSFSYPSLDEQTKIANFLSSIDEKLNLLNEKKTLLEDYKKGIMQKIFNQDIRFKDDNGNDFEDWAETCLGKIGEIITGKTPSTTDSDLWNGDIQFITPTDIKEGNKYQERTDRYVTNNSKLKVLPSNCIVFTCIASIGKMCISKYPSITNQQINSIIINKLNSFEYVYYWLLYITPFIKSTQANTTLPIINKTDFSKFSIKLPCIKEQTKIANFLSAIDEKIELVSNQVQDTQEYKKGLLQQMFV